MYLALSRAFAAQGEFRSTVVWQLRLRTRVRTQAISKYLVTFVLKSPLIK